MKERVKKGKNTVLAHLQHLREHDAEDLLSEAIASIKNNKIDLDITRQKPVLNQNEIHQAIMAASFNINPENREKSVESFPEIRSELSHWPVQLHLLNPMSPFLKNSDLVLAAGCDGRFKERAYYTEFAEKLPKNTVILTAGCAKYRYHKLPPGDINGIPRVLDAGQCNDSYSLVVIALKLKEIFELNNINELPIAYNIA